MKIPPHLGAAGRAGCAACTHTLPSRQHCQTTTQHSNTPAAAAAAAAAASPTIAAAPDGVQQRDGLRRGQVLLQRLTHAPQLHAVRAKHGPQALVAANVHRALVAGLRRAGGQADGGWGARGTAAAASRGGRWGHRCERERVEVGRMQKRRPCSGGRRKEQRCKHPYVQPRPPDPAHPPQSTHPSPPSHPSHTSHPPTHPPTSYSCCALM